MKKDTKINKKKVLKKKRKVTKLVVNISNSFTVNDLPKLIKNAKFIKQIKEDAKSQASFDTILANHFTDYNVVLTAIYKDAKYLIVLDTMNLGRKQGLLSLSKAQYTSARLGNAMALKRTLLTRGRKTCGNPDGYEDPDLLTRKELQFATADNPDIDVEKLSREDCLVILTKQIKGEIKLSKSQLTAIKYILATDISTFDPNKDVFNVTFGDED